VALPVLTQNYAMLQRNLLYTGLTRGKRLVVLVGQAEAVDMAVRNARGRQRWSKLKEWLRTEKSWSSPAATLRDITAVMRQATVAANQNCPT
jgi:exodeoxyribonuclease V alpha subunit